MWLVSIFVSRRPELTNLNDNDDLAVYSASSLSFARTAEGV